MPPWGGLSLLQLRHAPDLVVEPHHATEETVALPAQHAGISVYAYSYVCAFLFFVGRKKKVMFEYTERFPPACPRGGSLQSATFQTPANVAQMPGGALNYG